MQAWLDRQDAAAREGIDLLRIIVCDVGAPWQETIKWNAPSFALGGEDRVTLGVERGGGWRVVLHRGARVHVGDFAFEDRHGLAQWPTADRGVVRFRDLDAVRKSRTELTALIADWVIANGG